MCGFHAIAGLIAQDNLPVAHDTVIALPFDEREQMPPQAEGILITIRSIGDADADFVYIARRKGTVSEIIATVPNKIAVGSIFPATQLFVRGAFANGETLHFLASTTGMSIAYSIEAVRLPFNAEALA